jgi:ABC-type lipoprotein release transport system permease subunit
VQIHHPGYRDDPSVNNSMALPSGDLLQALESPPVTAWTARVRVPAMIQSERDARGVTLLGVDPAGELALGFDPGDMVEGRFLSGPDDRGLVIGRRLARRLETELGKRVVIMSQTPDNTVADRGVRIVGIYRARLEETEERYAYTGRGPLQELLEMGATVSEVAVTAGDYRRVAEWWPALARAAGPDLETLPWTTLDNYLYTMLSVQDTYNLIVMLIIFLVLAFGLVNTLVMAIFERVREIGLMLALGMRPRWIVAQILLESLVLLAIGLVVGNSLALLTIKPLEDGIDISGLAEGLAMGGMGTTLYPVLTLRDMLMSTAVVLCLGLAASLLPAWRAARYDPVDALNRT